MIKALGNSGQTLVLILMIMTISLAVGLSISQRLLAGYQRSEALDTSARALAVAEAALEKLLLVEPATLDSYIANNNCGSNCQLTITGQDGITATATVTLSYAGNSVSQFDTEVLKDNAYELSLSGYGNNKALEICWDNASSGDNPSLYVTFVYGASHPYSAARYAYNSASTIYGSNGFSTAAPDLSYPNCFTMSGQTSPRFVRVWSLYNDANIHVIPKDGATIPIQGYLLTSVGQVNNTKKTVSAVKSASYLPLEFDFAVFSTSEVDPLTN